MVEGCEESGNMSHLIILGSTCRRSRYVVVAKVSLTKHKLPYNVTTEMLGYMADINKVVWTCHAVDVPDEVVVLLLPKVAEFFPHGRSEDLGGEDLPHLLPLLSIWGKYGGFVPEAECTRGERGRTGGENLIVLPQYLAGHLGARDDDDMSLPKTETQDVCVHLR